MGEKTSDKTIRKNTLGELAVLLKRLVVFRNILDTPVVKKLMLLSEVSGLEEPAEGADSLYCDFASELFKETSDLAGFVNNFAITDDNCYIRSAAAGRDIDDGIAKALSVDLLILSAFAELTPEHVMTSVGYSPDGDTAKWLPRWANSYVDIRGNYNTMIERLPVSGYGIFARYSTFVCRDGDLVPVKYPDDQSVSGMYGYERERNQIIRNTRALLDGTGCNNMLLYGDAGTGKSSTVKAVANAFASEGLRLIEIKKNQLYELPDIIEKISDNPLKFIIFIDDLSFAGNDDNFSALKAVLEGSVSATGDNVAIYATSNRRHLVKESMTDRDGDALHTNDTLQEITSLSARFGLVITFSRPDKDEYLEIVKKLAEEKHLDMPEEELFSLAERHAIRCNGRSPRVAKQFVTLQKSGVL